MEKELRKSGISVAGDVPWGTHFCTFYETTEDLLDILVPFFKTGLENNEFCLWIISNSELLTIEEARNALRSVRTDLDSDLSQGRIELVRHDQWFLDGEGFDIKRVAHRFEEKLKHALAHGYAGMRVNGSPAWLYKYDDRELVNFERRVDELYPGLRIIASCTYPIPNSDAGVLLDVAEAHRFVITRRHGNWEVLETPELMQAKQEIQRLNEELEQRVAERTKKLEDTTIRLKAEIEERKAAEEALRRSEAKLKQAQQLANIGYWERDLIADRITWSKETGRILGLESFHGVPNQAQLRKFIHPDDWQHHQEVFNEALQEGRLFDVEVRFVRPDGNIRFVHIRDEIARDESGKPIRMFGAVQDITERWRAEEAVRRSEEHLRLVIDTIPTMAWSLRPDGTVDFVNQRWMDYTGLSLEEALEDSSRIVHPEDLPQALEKWASNKASGNQHEAEMRLRRVDGEYRWFLIRVSPLRDAQENIVKWYGVSTDIEDRKRAELEARTLINAIPVQIWSGPPDGTNDYVNDRWRAETGVGLEEVRGDGWETLLHPADRERVLKAWQYSVQTGTPYEQEERHRIADGTYRWYLNRGVPLRDDQGRIIRWYGTNTDITERKRAEETLRISEENFRRAFYTNPAPGVIVSVRSRQWLNVNGAFVRTLGYTAEEAVGKTGISLGIWLDTDEQEELWQRFQDKNAIDGYETRFITKSGAVIDVLLYVQAIELSGEECFLASVIDITERKRAEEKLRHSEVQLAQAQSLAHIGSWDWDLRTNAVTWSEELYHIFGLQPGTITVAGDAIPFIHPDDQDLVRSTVKNAVANKERYSFYYRAVRPDGTERIVHSRGSVLTDDHGEPVRVFGATQDVTELKHAEEKLKATTEQLRALSARVRSAREEESKRIAREIHDELGGDLTSLRWDLEEVGEIISEGADSTRFMALRKKVDAMINLTDTTLDTVRRLASELRPIALDELGLVDAIKWQARQFESRSGIAVGYESSLDEVDLHSQQSIAVFRILQEALTNILRHAQATKVTITIKQESGELVLAIKDNGRGITESEKSAAHSLGLLGMKERALLIGATIDITGTKGEGTEVVVKIPISASNQSSPAPE